MNSLGNDVVTRANMQYEYSNIILMLALEITITVLESDRESSNICGVLDNSVLDFFIFQCTVWKENQSGKLFTNKN